MEKRIKNIVLISIIIIDFVLLLYSISINHYDEISAIITLPLTLLIPTIVKKVLKIKITDFFEIIFYTFIFLAQFLGSCINLYDKIYWFDDFTHFLSGIFSCLIAIAILKIFKKNTNKDIAFNIIFIFGIVFIIAGCWELIEFAIDQILGSNMQHSIDSGVNDTMFDILSATIGAIVFNLTYFLENKNKKGIILKIQDKLIK